MTTRSVLCLTVSFLTLGLLPALADTQIIPQVADGAGWSTTIVLANTTAIAQAVTLTFNMDTRNSATTPWTPPFLENVSLSSISLPAGSTLFLHTSGTSAALTQGWGQVDAAAGVSGYAIFTSQALPNAAQDATAPAVSAANRILVPFDNSSGFASAIAVANPTDATETVQVNVRTSDGGTFSGTLPDLPAKGQTTFLMAGQFADTAGKSGLAEFYVTSGSISIIALRANPSGAFTAAPVYFESGDPVIGAPNVTQTSAPQTQVIPQVADGAGWATTIVLTNTTTGDLPVTLNFNQAVANGNGATSAWNPPFQDDSPLNFTLAAGSSVFLRTPGTATDLSQGWAELVADPRVVGYAIFTSQSSGKPAQDSTAPAVSASSRILVPFDNSSGLITAIALVNPNGSAEPVSVNIRTSDGTTTTVSTPDLPAEGQITFLMPTQFPATAGKSGLAEFYVSSGTISIIALRANPSGAITSAPVFFETGAPIITIGVDGGGVGGGTNNVVAGVFMVAKVSVTLTAQGTTTNSETIGGQFYDYTQAEWQVPFSAPTFGPCSVLDTISPPVKAPYLADTSLDAGTITVSGPNLDSGTTLPVSNTQTGPVYDYKTATGNALAYGGTYTITGNGGADVGAFTATATIPDSFAVTNWDAITSINRANGLTINWTGSGFDTVVIAATGQSSNETKTLSCVVPAGPGTFSVPQAALATLFPTQIATLTISATTLTPGTSAPFRITWQTLTPSLTAGGQVNYGAFEGQISILKTLAIQ
ncbi:MAG TPA: hypothetical protein VGL53_03320 [Bryobacteraceae bacterium]|jgi:hypothetical protein